MSAGRADRLWRGGLGGVTWLRTNGWSAKSLLGVHYPGAVAGMCAPDQGVSAGKRIRPLGEGLDRRPVATDANRLDANDLILFRSLRRWSGGPDVEEEREQRHRSECDEPEADDGIDEQRFHFDVVLSRASTARSIMSFLVETIGSRASGCFLPIRAPEDRTDVLISCTNACSHDCALLSSMYVQAYDAALRLFAGAAIA